ncbi:hypothetical protein F5Y17DRAFT_185475 [Xylariaceae sp. FL0594]|nr:hypothetical protein F5Y17DRAFT_185475 [Xylariaceae sp. FL0594]
MATRSLIDTPVEMVDVIIQHTLPEGFESLALTCKRLHALCTPYIQRHNQLKCEWNFFRYGKSGYYSAIELILRIAMEPIVIRYIKHADLSEDGTFDWE